MRKIASRKLLVFVLATIGVLAHLLTEQTWLIIACVYIGSQAAIDATAHFNKSSFGGELPDTDDEE